MPDFQYQAIGADGRALDGSIDAANRAQAIATLADRGTFVTQIDAAAEPTARNKARLCMSAGTNDHESIYVSRKNK